MPYDPSGLGTTRFKPRPTPELRREHFAACYRTCQRGECGHWGTDQSDRVGCLLHPTCPEQIARHLLEGGACLAEPQQFGPAYKPARLRPDLVGRFAVLTFHFNPCRYRRLATTYHQWAPSMGEVPVVCVELVIGDAEPEIPGAHVVRGDERHLLWQKEAMVNLGLRLLPPSIEYVAWVDHDILIDDPNWPAASVDLIGDRPISIQPWGRMHYLDRIGRTIRQAESSSAIAKSGRYPSTGPGAAWVARRRDLEAIGGIYDRNIVGGGDLVWFHALSGMRVDFLKRQSPAVRTHQEAWIAYVGGRIGYDCHRVSARHIWHGDAKNRQYVTRDEILKTHHFDPDRDIEPDPDTGLLRWTNQAPTQLQDDVQTYFLGRREDG